MHYFIDVIKKYFVFSGRASRKEFWMFQFLLMIIMTVVMMAIAICISFIANDMIALWIFISIYGVLSLIILPPSLAVIVRRLHDIGKSGLWYFISMVPLVGPFWFFFLLIEKGDTGTNLYGPDPYGVTTPAPVAPNPMEGMPTPVFPIKTEDVTEAPVEEVAQPEIESVVIKEDTPVI